MKTTSSGFTLVELIVVLTIIGILSTVGFIGYSGYIVSARDTKRIGSLTMIQNTLKKLSLQGYALSGFVKDSSNKGASTGQFYLKGKDISSSSDYNAGSIALDLIPEIPRENIDPKTNGNYRIGVYGSDYEIAGTLEDTGMSYILGSYKKRTSSGTLALLAEAPDTVNNVLKLANFNDSLKFAAGDVITNGTGTYTIDSIAGVKLYMSGSVAGIGASDAIRLNANDTHIIGNTSNGATATVTNCSDPTQTKTIAANLCPISDSMLGLVPYTVQ